LILVETVVVCRTYVVLKMLRSRKKLLPLFFDPTSPVRLSHFPPGFLSRPVFARKPTARRSAFLDLQNPHGKIRRSYVGAGRLDYPLLDQYFFRWVAQPPIGLGFLGTYPYWITFIQGKISTHVRLTKTKG